MKTLIYRLMLNSFKINLYKKKEENIMSNAAVENSSVHVRKEWKIDVAHTNIDFTVSHMVIAEVSGSFKEFEGTVVSAQADFSDAEISITIKSQSINTGNNDRDNHLRSADFFDAENHPEVTFKTTTVKKKSDNKLAVTGDLTMRSVTKQVVLDVKFKGTAVNPWGQLVAAFKATTVLNRKEWGLVWNTALEAGGFLVGEEIELNLNVELNPVQ